MSTTNTLSRWGIVAIEGEDAIAFIHGQLSNDIANLPQNKSRLAALCNPKGRIIATVLAIRHEAQVWLLAPTDVLAVLAKRLSMFVLRSRCTVRNAHAQLEVSFVPAGAANLPINSMEANWVGSTEAYCTLWGSTTQGMPGLHIQPRTSIIAPKDHAADEAFESHLWNLGLPYVCAATQEMFVPQQINWDLVGGVSFEKGCYPGQEIVARSHYLGKVKRRCFLAQAPLETAVAAGMDVWGSGAYAREEPIGQIATATQSNSAQYLMIELPTEWVDTWLNTNGALSEKELPLQVRIDKTIVALHGLRMPPYKVDEKGYALGI